MPKKRKLPEGDLQALSIVDKAPSSDPSQKKKKAKPKPSPPRSLLPKSTARGQGDPQAYIVDLASSAEGTTIAAASGAGVSLFAAREGGLAVQSSHSEHAGPATALCFAPEAAWCVESCGGDGTVVGWDARQNRVAYR